jgi:hypothetical protein
MAKDGNTYAKRQRETLKRMKAAEKRDKRKQRKDSPELPGDSAGINDSFAIDDDGNPPSSTPSL